MPLDTTGDDTNMHGIFYGRNNIITGPFHHIMSAYGNEIPRKVAVTFMSYRKCPRPCTNNKGTDVATMAPNGNWSTSGKG